MSSTKKQKKTKEPNKFETEEYNDYTEEFNTEYIKEIYIYWYQ